VDVLGFVPKMRYSPNQLDNPDQTHKKTGRHANFWDDKINWKLVKRWPFNREKASPSLLHTPTLAPYVPTKNQSQLRWFWCTKVSVIDLELLLTGEVWGSQFVEDFSTPKNAKTFFEI